MIPSVSACARLLRRLAAFSVLSACLLAACLPAAHAQIGVGFINDGNYTGTVGWNKGAVRGYRCPRGAVLRGMYHVDAKAPAPFYYGSGMTMDVSIYCTTIAVDNNHVPHAYHLTPDGTPTVNGVPNRRFEDQWGTRDTQYCRADQVITQMGGYARLSDPNYPAWSSALSFKCRPLELTSADKGEWVEFDISNENPDVFTVGDVENNFWKHNWSGWICPGTNDVPATHDSSVTGIFQQDGGFGWDGVNVYCAGIKQARHSAAIHFVDFEWEKQTDEHGWRVDLTKDGKVLEVPGVSGRNKQPYSVLAGTEHDPSGAENDPSVFQYDSELYVIPGGGYGAVLTHKPENVNSNSYVAESSCLGTIELKDHEDKSCDLTVIGRPDIGVRVTADDSKRPFLNMGETRDVTVSGVNFGPAAAKNAPGFALTVNIPRGWTPQPAAGCAVSGQTVKCIIDQELAAASRYGQIGGSQSFTFPIVLNSDARYGASAIKASLDRSKTDATNNLPEIDYNKDNDTATETISYQKRPILTLRKRSLGGVGEFRFSGDNGWEDVFLETVSSGSEKSSDPQTLLRGQVDLTLQEVSPSGVNPAFKWALTDAQCRGIGQDGNVRFDGSAGTVQLDKKATDYNTNISCLMTNQLVTTRTKKTSDPGSSAVQAGDVVTYTLTTQVVGKETDKDTVLTDSPGSGLEFVGLKGGESKFTADVSNPQELRFTLPKGTAVGSYSISYQVKVGKNAKGALGNSVVSDNGYCEPCQTQNPLVQIDTVKTSDIGNNNPSEAEGEIVYTLSTTVSGGSTTNPVVSSQSLI